MDKQSGVDEGILQRSPHRVLPRSRIGLVVGALLATIWLGLPRLDGSNGPSVIDTVQKCAIDNLHKDLSFLGSAKPITADEFISRHDRLAQALAASDVDAFVLEPGYTFQYVPSSGIYINRLAH